MLAELGRFLSRWRRGPGEETAVRTDGTIPLDIPGLAAKIVMRVHETPDVHVSAQIRSRGIWEPEETALLMALLGEGQTFVDVGANIGYFTLLGASLVGPAGKVYAFEPDPDNFRLLQSNCRLNQLHNTCAEEVALSDCEGSGELYLCEDNLGDHTIYGGDDHRRSRSIRLVEGDRFFAAAGAAIDVIKVDVQGAEYQVLKGLTSSLRAALPGLIILLEFSPNSLRAAGSGGEDLLQLLQDLGLNFYIFDHRNQRLLACDSDSLGKWVRLTQMDPSSEGFINIVCSGEVLAPRPGILIENNEQRAHDPLEYLLASHLKPWGGERCDIDNLHSYLFLSRGWSFPEPWGVWSEGDESRIRFYPVAPPAQVEFVELHFVGQYYGEPELARVQVCGQPVGDFDLVDSHIRIPADLLRGTDADIVLTHKSPVTPLAAEGAGDERRIKYGLKALSWSAR